MWLVTDQRIHSRCQIKLLMSAYPDHPEADGVKVPPESLAHRLGILSIIRITSGPHHVPHSPPVILTSNITKPHPFFSPVLFQYSWITCDVIMIILPDDIFLTSPRSPSRTDRSTRSTPGQKEAKVEEFPSQLRSPHQSSPPQVLPPAPSPCPWGSWREQLVVKTPSIGYADNEG